MQNYEEKQTSFLYRLVRIVSSMQNYMTRLSNYCFSRFYTWTSIVCFVLVGLHCLCRADTYPSVYGAGYLLGLFISTFALRVYTQYAFRNIVGVIAAALVFPLLLGTVLAKVWIGEVEMLLIQGLCLVLVYLLAVSVYCIDWSMIIGLCKAGGPKALVRLILFQRKHKAQLVQEMKGWQNTAFQRVKHLEWLELNHGQRVAYIEHILANEVGYFGIKEPVVIHHYALGRGMHAMLDFSVEPARNRITWDTDAVDWYPPEQIIQDAILCLQGYYWLMQMDADLRNDLSDEKDLIQLQCQDFCDTSSALAFDLLTGDYARFRADWYCGFDDL